MELKLIIILAIIVYSLLGVGFFMGYQYKDIYITTGCWSDVAETERSIAIRVSGRSIEKIINTARHEVCHEIHYRLINYNATLWNNIKNKEKEEFADTCNPEDYLNEGLIFTNITLSNITERRKT